MNVSEFLILYGRPVELVQKLARKFWLFFFHILHVLHGKPQRFTSAYLIASELSGEDLGKLAFRARFYTPDLVLTQFAFRSHLKLLSGLLSPNPLLIFGPRKKFIDWLVSLRPGTFDVDFRTNPLDGWAWIGFANYVRHDPIDFSAAYRRFMERVTCVKGEGRTKTYVFGTGPSLAQAIDRDWSDGYRIVCNTIVRDPLLWNHLRPDFIVAGDAIYHFGHTSFARAFRRDLRARLEFSDTLFLYPAQFHAIVARELAGLEDQLIPIPSGWQRTIHVDLTRSFRLPNLGNVLGLLLLPLACTLSKHVFMWGFDGRAPDDKLFWSNSNKHTYAEHMDELKMAHPRFFDYHIPQSDPNKYVRDNQGDRLEIALQHAERNGWTFAMMHPSWTPTLQRRFHGGN